MRLLSGFGVVLVVAGLAGCIDDAGPIVGATNRTSSAADVTVRIREVASPDQVAARLDFRLDAGGSGSARVDLRGPYNVTASTPDGRSGWLVMELWHGSWLGGQLSVEVDVLKDRIAISSVHAD